MQTTVLMYPTPDPVSVHSQNCAQMTRNDPDMRLRM